MTVVLKPTGGSLYVAPARAQLRYRVVRVTHSAELYRAALARSNWVEGEIVRGESVIALAVAVQ